jgi:uncharacterized protein with PQ loop repeat
MRFFLCLVVVAMCCVWSARAEAGPVASQWSQQGKFGVVTQASSGCKNENCSELFSAFAFMNIIASGLLGGISTIGLLVVTTPLPTKIWGGISLAMGLVLALTAIVPVAFMSDLLASSDSTMKALPWVGIGAMVVGLGLSAYSIFRIHQANVQSQNKNARLSPLSPSKTRVFLTPHAF